LSEFYEFHMNKRWRWWWW